MNWLGVEHRVISNCSKLRSRFCIIVFGRHLRVLIVVGSNAEGVRSIIATESQDLWCFQWYLLKAEVAHSRCFWRRYSFLCSNHLSSTRTLLSCPVVPLRWQSCARRSHTIVLKLGFILLKRILICLLGFWGSYIHQVLPWVVKLEAFKGRRGWRVV